MNGSMAWTGIAVTCGILAASGSARAETPPSVSIQAAMRGGSGCASGRAPAALSGDYERLLVMDVPLEAHAGPNVPLSKGRVFCQLTIDLEHTPGWSYTVSSVSGHRGRTDLDDDVTAVLSVERWFTGYKGDAASFEVTFRGPTGGDYFRREPAQNVGPWSPCGVSRTLNIKSSVHVSRRENPDGIGSITTTPAWGVHLFRLHWRKC